MAHTNTITDAVTFSNTGYVTFGNASDDTSTFDRWLYNCSDQVKLDSVDTVQTSNDCYV